MSDMPQPNIALSLKAIHHGLTRALTVAAERSQAYAGGGFPDEATRDGFATYARCLVTALRAHHRSEDEVAFPFIRDKLSQMPFDRLSAEHQAIEPRLSSIEAALDRMAAGAAAAGPLRSTLCLRTGQAASFAVGDLQAAVGRILDLWHPHIRIEETHVNPEAAARVMPPEERLRLRSAASFAVGGLLSQFNQQHSQPDYLMVPFTLFNLRPQERAMMAQAFPPIVIQQLVPMAWKEKWAPIEPFLLP